MCIRDSCIPAGPLRETINQGLKKIDAIIFTGDDGMKNINIHFSKNIQSFNTNLKITKHLKTKQTSFLAFCALANPMKFYETLEKNNFKVNSTKSFPDHYDYSLRELTKLIDYAEKNDLDIITTEKDYFRIFHHKLKKIKDLSVKIDILDKSKFVNKIKSFI